MISCHRVICEVWQPSEATSKLVQHFIIKPQSTGPLSYVTKYTCTVVIKRIRMDFVQITGFVKGRMEIPV